MPILDKPTIKEFDALNLQLKEAYANLKSAVDAANEAVNGYNTIIYSINQKREEVHDNLQSTFDDRSETWQDSDRGQAFADFIEEWDTELDEAESYDDLTVIEEFELPVEPD